MSLGPLKKKENHCILGEYCYFKQYGFKKSEYACIVAAQNRQRRDFLLFLFSLKANNMKCAKSQLRLAASATS